MTKKSDALEDHEFLEKLVVGIGEVSRITGLPTRQIRYWEDKGIITAADSDGSKTRCYGYFNIKKITLIKEMLDDGYTLEAANKKVTSRMDKIMALRKTLKGG